MVSAQKYHNPSKTFSPQLKHVQFFESPPQVELDPNTSQTPIEWESVDVTPQLKDGRTVIPDKAIESVKKNFIALKGPLAVFSFPTLPVE